MLQLRRGTFLQDVGVSRENEQLLGTGWACKLFMDIRTLRVEASLVQGILDSWYNQFYHYDILTTIVNGVNTPLWHGWMALLPQTLSSLDSLFVKPHNHGSIMNALLCQLKSWLLSYRYLAQIGHHSGSARECKGMSIKRGQSNSRNVLVSNRALLS